MSADVDVLRRSLERERKARKASEQILEQKSLELYESNCALSTLADKLRTEVARTEVLLDSTSDAIITVWSDNRITLFNSAAEQIFGYVRSEVVGMDITQLQLTAPAEQRRLSFELPQADDSAGHRELLAQDRTGKKFWIEVTSSRIKFDGQDAVTMVIRNVSQRKNLENKLRHSQKMESVGQLAAGIAHEINTPIQFVGDNGRFLKGAFEDLIVVLNLYRQLDTCLQASVPPDELLQKIKDTTASSDLQFVIEEIPEAISQSLEGIERVARIVSAMKDFSHPGQHKKFIDVNQAITSTTIVCRNEWKYCADLVTDFDPRLPPVNCLPDEFKQIILNLVVNAGHAIADANKALNRDTGLIRISTHRDGDFAEIRVSDSGLGIPSDIQNNVFDPFFTTKDVGTGTGQGLAICYAIVVEMHGGTIHFDTAKGEGTTFVIRLPFDDSQRAEDQGKTDEKTNSVC